MNDTIIQEVQKRIDKNKGMGNTIMKSKVIMILDSETIGFGIYENNKCLAIKFNKDTGKFDKRIFDYSINNFEKITEEFKEQAKKDLHEKINFNDSFSGRFVIEKIEDLEEIEKYFKDKNYNVSKRNGFCIWKTSLSDKEYRARIKEKKAIVMKEIDDLGYTVKYEKLAYDIGYTVAMYDRKSKKMITLMERSMLVKEVFLDMDIMKKAYFFNKHPLYISKLANHEIDMLPMQEIVDIMARDIAKYDITVFSNYNAQFDTNAIKNTIDILKCRRREEFKQMNIIWDIWRMACDTLYDRPSFVRKALLNGWISASGKYFSTNAEVGYKYITGEHKFEEEHTALSDARIETHILEYIFRQQKSKVSERGIIAHPWKKLKISNYFNIIETHDKFTIEEVNKLYIKPKKK